MVRSSWSGYITHFGETRNAHRFLSEEPFAIWIHLKNKEENGRYSYRSERTKA
jgi:hypothetical protein